MTKMPIYYAHELGVDLCLEIALFFFEARRNRGLSIAEAAAKSGLSVNDVDELETRGGRYDFAKITNLLELYANRNIRKIFCVLTMAAPVFRGFCRGNTIYLINFCRLKRMITFVKL